MIYLGKSWLNQLLECSALRFLKLGGIPRALVFAGNYVLPGNQKIQKFYFLFVGNQELKA